MSLAAGAGVFVAAEVFVWLSCVDFYIHQAAMRQLMDAAPGLLSRTGLYLLASTIVGCTLAGVFAVEVWWWAPLLGSLGAVLGVAGCIRNC